MLVCDLDGTLLNGQGTMTTATRTALRQAAQAGMEIVFATGRRHSFAGTVIAPLGLGPDTIVISSNGALISTAAGTRMQQISMPVPTVLELCRQLDGYRSSLIFTFQRTGMGSLVVEDVALLRSRIPRWVDANAHEIACYVPLEKAFALGEEPIQGMICGNLKEMAAAMEVLDGPELAASGLRETISIHRTEYAQRDLTIVDLMARGCSKGTALARLAAGRGIDAAEIVCIGDNMNDADMLAFAGQAFVMRNAPPELLAMAAENGWAITTSNEEDGAARAILGMLEKAKRIPAPMAVPAG